MNKIKYEKVVICKSMGTISLYKYEDDVKPHKKFDLSNDKETLEYGKLYIHAWRYEDGPFKSEFDEIKLKWR